MKNVEKYTFESPYDMDEAIVSELNKIAKKFDKKYSTLVTWEKTEKEVYKTSATGLKFPVTFLVYDITVNLPVIKWNGYEYVATLKKECEDEEGNQVFTSLDEDFSEYFDTNFRCDHCNTNRRRKTVHIFRNEDGDELMIASTCSKQYFGINVASKVQKLFDFFSKGRIGTSLGGIFEGRWLKSNPLDKKTFCRLCYGIIKRDGKYHSGGWHGASTKDEASQYFHPSLSFLTSEQVDNLRIEIDNVLKLSDGFEFDKMVEYWKSKDSKDNFTNNVNVALDMNRPQLGYLAWAVFDYMKEVEGFGKREAKKESNYIGTVGEKIESAATVRNIKEMSTMFGNTSLVEMEDDDNNILNWWTSTSLDFKEGDEIIISGKVKKHDEFKGTKITTIKNCKVFKNDE